MLHSLLERTRISRLVGSGLLLALTLGCAGPAGNVRADTAAPTQPKRVVAAIISQANILSWKLSAGTELRAGIDTVEQLIHAGLSLVDDQRLMRPQLAEAVPTTENGLWKVFPDGTMETSWKIRDGARWHDGHPFTSADLLFTATAVQDRELPAFRDARFKSIKGVEAPDERTIVVRWNEPFIDADHMFTVDMALPLPKHILEPTYLEAKATFTDLPYWSNEFVGAGPYRVKELERGSYLILEANSDYVLGRPKIDVFEIRFITDSNTLMANILAGTVEMTLGRNISVEQGLELQHQWAGGRVVVAPANLVKMWPQFINPNPAILLDVRARRALLHAIDRDEMALTLQAGVTPAAHSFLNPGQEPYREIEARQVVRYDFDPRRTGQLLEELGMSRGSDSMYREAAGQLFTVDLLVSASQEVNVKSAFAVGDYWRRAGVTPNNVVEPTQLAGAQRREYEAARPGFFLTRSGSDVDGFPALLGSQAPLPENDFVGSNAARYRNPEFDALIERYFVTVPLRQRQELVGQIIHQISDQLIVFPIFYGAEPVVIANRISGVGARPNGTTQAWNVLDWNAS